MIDPAAIVISGGGDVLSLFIEVVIIVAIVIVLVLFIKWLMRQ